MTEQNLEETISEEVRDVAYTMAEAVHVPEDPLQSLEVQATKIERELSQCMLLAKRHIRNGFSYCVKALKELALTDTSIDLESFKNNVNTAFSRLESVAKTKDLCSKAKDGESWKSLLGLNETSMDLLYRGAKQLFDLGHHPEAEAAFFFLTTIDYAQYAFWLGLGHAAFHLGNLNQAINAYEMADDCQPGSIWPHIYMANCFEALHDYSESLICLEEAERELAASAEKDQALSDDIRARIANAKARS